MPAMGVGMAQFNIQNKTDRALRTCRTHAFGARLFAGCAIYPSHAQMWEEIARAWDDLAQFKQHVAESRNRDRQLGAASARCLTDPD